MDTNNEQTILDFTFEGEEGTMEGDILEVVDRTSRHSSFSSCTEGPGSSNSINKRRKRKMVEDEGKDEELTDVTGINKIKSERETLESYLFNESSKINKAAIKFIMTKWMSLEGKLYELIIENEKLKTQLIETKNKSETKTYANATQTRIPTPELPTNIKTIRENRSKSSNEILLIKPINEEDKNTNEEIKQKVTKALESVKNKLKVKNIRQMRQKGLVLELESKKDTEVIKNAQLDKIGIKVEEPRKMEPMIIIYDIEDEYKAEELKEQLIYKNFEINENNVEQIKTLNEKINFKFYFKTKNKNKVNWVIQMPGEMTKKLIEKKKVYLNWRIHNLKE